MKRMMAKILNQRGFTLVEMLLALALLATAGAVALRTFSGAVTSFSESKIQQEASEDARRLMEVITADLRDAGFGVFLGDLSDVSANKYFSYAFEDICSGSATVSDGIILRALKMGGVIRSEMPASSAEMKMDDVSKFLPYDNGFALVYQNGEFQVLHITHVQLQPNHLQHNKDKTKWKIPEGSPIYRVDEIVWNATGETITRTVNKTQGYAGLETHRFSRVQLLKFEYILRDNRVVSELNNDDATKIMCIRVTLDMFRVGGRPARKHHVRLVQTVAPRNL